MSERTNPGDRVRHVPIHVESRDNRQSQQRQSINKHHRPHFEDQRQPPNHDQPMETEDQGSRTSSINIDYQGPSQFMGSNNMHYEQPKNYYQRERDPQEPVRESKSPSDESRAKPKSPMPTNDDQENTASGQNDQRFPAKNHPQAKPTGNSFAGIPIEDEFRQIDEELRSIVQRIKSFKGLSEKDREYRCLYEMLTNCMLNMDRLVCSTSEQRELRRSKYSAVEKASEFLQAQAKINFDLDALLKSLLPKK